MKKLILTIASLLISSTALAETALVKVYNHVPNYNIYVNYQICARNNHDCAPKVNHISIPKGTLYKTIDITNSGYYVSVVSAYERDDQGLVHNHGDFTPEECRGFINDAIHLDDKEDRDVQCVITK